MDSPINKNLLVVVYIIGSLVALGSAYSIYSTIHVVQTTGVLKVTSTDPQASISVSQPNHQAAAIGVGTAQAHLNPGTYQVMVGDKGTQATRTVQVSRQHTTDLSLNPDQGSLLPSVGAINFQNISDLVSSGLTSSQATKLVLELFEFKPTAQTITIDPNSIAPGPHDPNTSTSFTLNFSLTIDGQPYDATASYQTLIDLHLSLYDPQSHALVFDSSNQPSL